jgi:alpha-tubulin suppressor-like RCC1 family protein
MAPPHVAPAAAASRSSLLLGALLLLGGCDPLFGPGQERDSVFPVPVEVAPALRFTHVGVGWVHSCATAESGTVHCWGKNEFGELGGHDPAELCHDALWGTFPCTGTPQPVVGAPPLRYIQASIGHSCGLAADGQAWCWGYGLGGQLGDGAPHPRPGPALDARCPYVPGDTHGRSCRASAGPVAGDARFVRLRVARSGFGSCGLTADGDLHCWGPVDPLGLGVPNADVPVQMPTGLAFQDFAIQGHVACGIEHGAAWCWGSNWYGELGIGSAGPGGDSFQPVPVIGGHTFTQVVGTLSNICALRGDGAAWCWGSLPALHGTDPPRYGGTPVPAGGPSFASLAAGGGHVCGIDVQGDAWCWGANSFGQFGDGTRRERANPGRVSAPDGVRFKQLALGGSHSCGLATDGRVFCWGHNGLGQVGRTPGQRVRR